MRVSDGIGAESTQRREATSLWAPEHRALTLGLVLTITFVASEALAVAPAVPVLARDLGGLRLYGWVFSAFMLAGMVGVVLAGEAADRRGPAPPYVAGLTLFTVGLVVAGRAPSMPVLVADNAEDIPDLLVAVSIAVSRMSEVRADRDAVAENLLRSSEHPSVQPTDSDIV